MREIYQFDLLSGILRESADNLEQLLAPNSDKELNKQRRRILARNYITLAELADASDSLTPSSLAGCEDWTDIIRDVTRLLSRLPQPGDGLGGSHDLQTLRHLNDLADNLGFTLRIASHLTTEEKAGAA